MLCVVGKETLCLVALLALSFQSLSRIPIANTFYELWHWQGRQARQPNMPLMQAASDF